MGDDEDEDEVVFLDDDEDAIDEGWLAEERVENTDAGVLPPRAARNRLFATLAALALFLGATGAAFTAAYHRHMTDLRNANLLELTAAASPPQIPALANLAFASTWHAAVSEQVLVPVVNHSPRPVVLLGAVLREPGMIGSASLAPTGRATLKSGQVGDFAGRVTVDCTRSPGAFAGVIGSDPSVILPKDPVPSLRVRARTSGGQIAQTTLDPESGQTFGGQMQERICLQQGSTELGAPAISMRYDTATHVLTFGWSATSRADIALEYRLELSYSYPQDDPSAVPCRIESLPAQAIHSGVLLPGATLDTSVPVQMSDCPAGTVLVPTEMFLLSIDLASGGVDLGSEQASFPVTLN
jgi:hypothetical protein